MVVSWVEHVKQVVQHSSSLAEDKEELFPVCKSPVIKYVEPSFQTYKYVEQPTKITESKKIHWGEYWYAKQHKPWTNAVGRSHAKGRAKGCGQVLKKSFVQSGVHIEKVFSQY